MPAISYAIRKISARRARIRADRAYLAAAEPPSRLDLNCRTAGEWRAASARLQAMVDEAWPEQRARIYDAQQRASE